jgi:2-oxoglutarate ferredoxin oxidoreductase subunit alpha
MVTTIKLAGPAGMGIKSAGQLLSKVLILHNFNLRDYSEYPSLVRGGHNTYQVSFSSDLIYSPHYQVDFFFSLLGGHWQEHQAEFSSNTLVFGDEDFTASPKNAQYVNLPIKQIVDQVGSQLVANTICLGIVAYLLDLKTALFKEALKQQYGKNADINILAFEKAYDYAQNNYSNYRSPRIVPSKKSLSPLLADGNESFGWGFIKAGGDFYAAYPMTPATGTLHFLAEKQKDYPLTVLHHEDEIAVANIAAGAAIAGKRTAVGTSGGGFALMDETVSFCGIAEIGMVYYLVSRPGPATGLPTWTSQSDLLHAVFSGHGEFPKVVLAPGSQEESFEFGQQALNLAVHLQTPVIVVSDKFLGESSASLIDFAKQKPQIDSGKHEDSPLPGFQRYRTDIDDGISPLTYPGQKDGEFLSNSYEHDAFGYATENSAIAQSMAQKRQKKLQTAQKLAPKDLVYGPKNAKKLIICWGSPTAALREMIAAYQLPDYQLLQVRTLWPLSSHLESIIKKYRQVILVENNQTAQLGRLLKSQFNFTPNRQILKYDGRPFFPEELYQLITAKDN